MRCPTLGELPPPPEGRSGWPWTEESPRTQETMPDGRSWPRVSIVTPSYQPAPFLEETVRSILLQGYPDLEYIIIDGGSTDGSVEIIRKYEPWLAHWVSEPDKGQSDALNKGFERATGSVVAWLNSDDWYLPNILPERVAHLASHPEAALVYGGCKCVTETGCLMRVVAADRPYPLRDMLVKGERFPQPAVFMRAESLRSVGGVDPGLHYVMCYALWLNLSLIGECHAVPGCVAYYRYHTQSKTVSDGYKFRLEELAFLDRWPPLTELLTASEIADARSLLHVRAALEYILADDETKAADHFRLVLQGRAWSYGELGVLAATVANFAGMSRRCIADSAPLLAALRRVLIAACPPHLRKRLCRRVESHLHMRRVRQAQKAGCARTAAPHLMKVIWYDPRCVLRRHFWSVSVDALMGRRFGDRLRAAYHAISGPSSKSSCSSSGVNKA